MISYQEFLDNKVIVSEDFGFEIDKSEISDMLFPHQKDIVYWAIRGGRRAVFAAFGLGKTFMQLEIARLIIKYTGKPFFIGLPLGVKREFFKDAKKLGVRIEYAKTREDIKDDIIYCSNYERIRDGKFDPEVFGGVSFDEASVIRSMGTLTTQYILSHFTKIKYRFVFTATPSPNAYHEILKYSEFLGIMDISQALNRYFKRDSVKAHNSSLLEHREEDFWTFVSSWACFITKPSDLGYDDTGYDLPPHKVIYHVVKNTKQGVIKNKFGELVLFAEDVKSLSQAAKEKRESIMDRCEKAIEICNKSPKDHFILWHHLEPERACIEHLLPESKSVYGSQKLEQKEALLNEFSVGKYKYLATKPEIAGSGSNFQYHCHKAVFVGINDKFNDFIQAIHRILRFQQKHEVEINIIHTENEYAIMKRFMAKWKRHDKLIAKMVEKIKKYGLHNITLDKKRKMTVERKEFKGKNFIAINNDSVFECDTMKDDSIDLIHTSIPFSDLFEYAESYSDMGQSNGDEEFFRHMDYLTPNLLRITKPGRIAAIHVKDVIKYSFQNGLGMTTVHPFSDNTRMHFVKHGWHYCGRITVNTDVVRENAQTYRLGWTENCKDGTKMGVGLPEYVLLFRKAPTNSENAYADTPVVKSKDKYSKARWQIDAHAFWRSSGNRYLSSKEIAQLDLGVIMNKWRDLDKNLVYDYLKHVQLCEEMEHYKKLPSTFMATPPQSTIDDIWDDVVRMKTLNTSQSLKGKIKHVCPLQFDIVDRIIERYSNPGEIVLDPFGGIMTVPYRAIKMGRKGIGIELHEDYWRDGIVHCRNEELKVVTPTLFDLETV
jgi:DNA modification methylase